jgi:hypothetical protein
VPLSTSLTVENADRQALQAAAGNNDSDPDAAQRGRRKFYAVMPCENSIRGVFTQRP